MTCSPANAVIPFSSGLLLGDGFIRELYVHMGFHPAWKFERVVELIFEGGQLTRSHDRSEQLAESDARSNPASYPTPTPRPTCWPGSTGPSSSTTGAASRAPGSPIGCDNRLDAACHDEEDAR